MHALRTASRRFFEAIARRPLSSVMAVGAIAGALAFTTVHSGDTLSAIAQRDCGNASDWTGIYAANQSVIGGNPNLIEPGQQLRISCAQADVGQPAQVTGYTAPAQQQDSYSGPAQSSYGTVSTAGDSGFEACVISRESGGDPDVWNASGHWGLFQFSAGTWAEYGGSPGSFGYASAAEQEQVFDNAMAQGGEYNWSPYDGC
jgi:hypothetical protein